MQLYNAWRPAKGSLPSEAVHRLKSVQTAVRKCRLVSCRCQRGSRSSGMKLPRCTILPVLSTSMVAHAIRSCQTREASGEYRAQQLNVLSKHSMLKGCLPKLAVLMLHVSATSSAVLRCDMSPLLMHAVAVENSENFSVLWHHDHASKVTDSGKDGRSCSHDGV